MPMHVITPREFQPEQLDEIYELADRMHKDSATLAGCVALKQGHNGYVAGTSFYEPSTRTRMSFESAALRLGIELGSTENAAEFSSAAKGETIQDTVRTLDKYFHVLIMRTKEAGDANRAAAVSRVPIINGGDGKGEHPTQALLDLYTIQKDKGRKEDLRVVIGGDLKHGRTARSLARLLSMYDGNHIDFVSTPELQIERDITDHLDQTGTSYAETDEMYDVLASADVVYWTRLQKERLSEEARAAGVANNFVIDQAALGVMKSDAILLHPLPRVGEITPDVDSDPRARYFEQVENGLYVRMALLDRVLAASYPDGQLLPS